MKYLFIGIAALLGIVGVTLLITSFQPKDPLAAYDLNDLTVPQMVAELENRTDEPDTLQANITGSKLSLVANGETLTYPLPEDLFYLSFAPYINTTHPCGNHNLITCRGELKNETFQVTVTDSEGVVVSSQEITTYDNGFAGIWLPSNMTGIITVTYQGLSASAPISTNVIDNTCLTTMELS